MERLSPNEVAVVGRAISNKVQSSTFLLSPVGLLRDDAFGGLLEAVRVLARQEGIETVFAFGITDTHLRGILHTSSSTVEPEKWVSSLFPQGDSDVDEHDGDANTLMISIHLGLFGLHKDREALWTLTAQLVQDAFMEKVGVA